MNAQNIIDSFKKTFPGKRIVCIPEHNPSEIICEIDPSSLHPSYSKAFAAIKRSRPHYHKIARETYKVKEGVLKLHIDSDTLTLMPGESHTVLPLQVHFAEGDFTIVDVYSEYGWTPEDHYLVEDQ